MALLEVIATFKLVLVGDGGVGKQMYDKYIYRLLDNLN